MSGSRAVLLKLSVQDADVVRTQLTQMGEQGERALQRLDAAARAAAGSGVSGPISRGGGGGGGGGFGGFRNAIGQAGFQVQDFAVQVQGGTSALTALSQQGSQFLGIFGAGGAIAGALLTVGILVSRFIELGTQSESTRQAIERVKEAIVLYGQAVSQVNDIMLTAEQRSAAQEQAKRAEARATLDLAIVIEREAIARANAAAVRLQADEGAIGAARRDGLQVPDAFNRAGQRGNAGAQIAQRAEQAGQRLLDLERRLRELDNTGVDRGNGQQGPNAPTGRTGGGAGGRVAGDGGRGFLQLLRDQQAFEENNGADLETAKRKMREIGDETQRTADITRTLGMTFSSAFEDAIVKGKSFRDVLGGIAEDLARLVLRQTVTAPLANALGSVVSGLFGPSGPAKGAPDPSLAGPFSYGGQRAMGGPVDPSSIYMVGERGPEMFVPNTAGNIVPNGMGGGVTVNMTINAQGAGPREIDVLRTQIPALAKAAVEDAARRGGSFSRSVRGR